MQLFVVGPPRSGITIVTQVLNQHEDIKIFDEIDLIQVGRYGDSVIGTLQAFLLERGVYQTYRTRARESSDAVAALRSVMSELARPHAIWGEKNPRYATQLDVLRRYFPDAVVVFVLRDPREVVNSCLAHRDSPLRAPTDFWVKDTVAQALALVDGCLEPLRTSEADLVVVRYEAFAAQPKATLDAALGGWGLTFPDADRTLAHPAPETAGEHQFFRDGAPLPWKTGNLSPLHQARSTRDRVDPDDPAWAEVDALAREFGYD